VVSRETRHDSHQPGAQSGRSGRASWLAKGPALPPVLLRGLRSLPCLMIGKGDRPPAEVGCVSRRTSGRGGGVCGLRRRSEVSGGWEGGLKWGLHLPWPDMCNACCSDSIACAGAPFGSSTNDRRFTGRRTPRGNTRRGASAPVEIEAIASLEFEPGIESPDWGNVTSFRSSQKDVHQGRLDMG